MSKAETNFDVQMSLSAHVLNSFGFMSRSEIVASCANSLQLYKEPPNYLQPQWLHHFKFQPGMCEGSTFSTS